MNEQISRLEDRILDLEFETLRRRRLAADRAVDAQIQRYRRQGNAEMVAALYVQKVLSSIVSESGRR